MDLADFVRLPVIWCENGRRPGSREVVRVKGRGMETLDRGLKQKRGFRKKTRKFSLEVEAVILKWKFRVNVDEYDTGK